MFEFATDAFMGTEHLLRPDIYEQGTPPCPQALTGSSSRSRNRVAHNVAVKWPLPIRRGKAFQRSQGWRPPGGLAAGKTASPRVRDVVGQDICWVQIAVDPDRRPFPSGGSDGVVPYRLHCIRVGINPRSAAMAIDFETAPATSVRAPPLPRPVGAPAGAGRCSAVKKAASTTADALRLTGAMSAGAPGTHVVTIHGRENRREGSPSR